MIWWFVCDFSRPLQRLLFKKVTSNKSPSLLQRITSKCTWPVMQVRPWRHLATVLTEALQQCLCGLRCWAHVMDRLPSWAAHLDNTCCASDCLLSVTLSAEYSNHVFLPSDDSRDPKSLDRWRTWAALCSLGAGEFSVAPCVTLKSLLLTSRSRTSCSRLLIRQPGCDNAHRAAHFMQMHR